MLWGFPGVSDGKEFACKAGELGSIPGSGRSTDPGKCIKILAWRIPRTEESGHSPWVAKSQT